MGTLTCSWALDVSRAAQRGRRRALSALSIGGHGLPASLLSHISQYRRAWALVFWLPPSSPPRRAECYPRFFAARPRPIRLCQYPAPSTTPKTQPGRLTNPRGLRTWEANVSRKLVSELVCHWPSRCLCTPGRCTREHVPASPCSKRDSISDTNERPARANSSCCEAEGEEKGQVGDAAAPGSLDI